MDPAWTIWLSWQECTKEFEFNSQSWHIPRFRVQSQVRGHRGSNWSLFLSPSLLSLSLSSIFKNSYPQVKIKKNILLIPPLPIYHREFLSLLSCRGKKSNEYYFFLVHRRISCARKAGSIFCCQRQVPETWLQCSNTDTLWPSKPSLGPLSILSHSLRWEAPEPSQALRKGALTIGLRTNHWVRIAAGKRPFCSHQMANTAATNYKAGLWHGEQEMYPFTYSFLCSK